MMLKDRNGLCDSQSTLSGPGLKKNVASCKSVTFEHREQEQVGYEAE